MNVNLRISVMSNQNLLNNLILGFDPLPENLKEQFSELRFEARKIGETNWIYLNNMSMNVTEMSLIGLMSDKDWHSITESEYEMSVRFMSEVREEYCAIAPEKINIALSGDSVDGYSAIKKGNNRTVQGIDVYYIFTGDKIQNNSVYLIELRDENDKTFFADVFCSEMSGNTLRIPPYCTRENSPLSFARIRRVDISAIGDDYTITYSPYNSISVPIIVS